MNPLPPTVAALERRLGLFEDTLTAEDLARAEEALGDATALVLAEVPTAKAAEWAVDAPTVVVLVTLKAARREFENPQGLSSESVGDHAIGLSESSGVYLTRREIAQVRRAATGRPGGFVGTVRTASPYN